MRTRVPRNELEMLAAVPLFSRCSRSELREIARLGTPVEVPAGRVLTRQGQPGREFFLVVEGKAECTANGRKMAVFGPGDYFGELALIEHSPRTATVTALTPMTVLVLDSREFSTLLSAAPSIAPKMLGELARRLRETQESHTH